MKERLKKTPFYKFKERKLLKKQIDSMTNAESQAALDLAKKEEKDGETQETGEEGRPQQEDDRRRDAGITEAHSPHPLSRADIKKARILMLQRSAHAEAEQRWMDDYVAALWVRRSASGARPASSDSGCRGHAQSGRRGSQSESRRASSAKEGGGGEGQRAARRAHMREKIGLIPNLRAILFEVLRDKASVNILEQGLGRQIWQGRAVLGLRERAHADAESRTTTGLGGGMIPLCSRVARHR